MSIAAVILAAGGSSRLGHPKQLIEHEGESLLRRSVRAAVDGGCAPVVVVLGADARLCGPKVADLPTRVLHNEDWPTGIASSIRRGITDVESLGSVEGAILMVCDQPHVSADVLQQLIARRDLRNTIVASAYGDTVGVPALFERVHFPELLALSGDVGAKSLFAQHADTTADVEFPLGTIDIDSADDEADAQRQRR